MSCFSPTERRFEKHSSELIMKGCFLNLHQLIKKDAEFESWEGVKCACFDMLAAIVRGWGFLFTKISYKNTIERNYQINELDFHTGGLRSNPVKCINEWVWWSLSHSLWTSVCVTKPFTWFSMIGGSVQKGLRVWQLEHCRSGWRCIEVVRNFHVICHYFTLLH